LNARLSTVLATSGALRAFQYCPTLRVANNKYDAPTAVNPTDFFQETTNNAKIRAILPSKEHKNALAARSEVRNVVCLHQTSTGHLAEAL
jgi:hypothetical protein